MLCIPGVLKTQLLKSSHSRISQVSEEGEASHPYYWEAFITPPYSWTTKKREFFNPKFSTFPLKTIYFLRPKMCVVWILRMEILDL